MYSQGMQNGRRGRLDERYIRRLLDSEQTPPPGRGSARGRADAAPVGEMRMQESEMRGRMAQEPEQQPSCRGDGAGGCSCTSGSCNNGGGGAQETGYGCGEGGRYAITDRPLAMAYVPVQDFSELYGEEEGLRRGTIFKDLDLSFVGAQRREGKRL